MNTPKTTSNTARYQAALARVEERILQLQNYLDASIPPFDEPEACDPSEMEQVAAKLDEINQLVELWAYED